MEYSKLWSSVLLCISVICGVSAVEGAEEQTTTVVVVSRKETLDLGDLFRQAVNLTGDGANDILKYELETVRNVASFSYLRDCKLAEEPQNGTDLYLTMPKKVNENVCQLDNKKAFDSLKEQCKSSSIFRFDFQECEKYPEQKLLKSMSIIASPNKSIIASPNKKRDVTITIPGEVDGKQTILRPEAFSNLLSNTLQLHLKFEERNRKKVKIEGGDCSRMFENSVAIRSIDFSGFDEFITSMDNMFAGCKGILSLDLKPLSTDSIDSFDYKNETNQGFRVRGMFEGCTNLKSVDISSWPNDKKKAFFQDDNKIVTKITKTTTQIRLAPQKVKGNPTNNGGPTSNNIIYRKQIQIKRSGPIIKSKQNKPKTPAKINDINPQSSEKSLGKVNHGSRDSVNSLNHSSPKFNEISSSQRLGAGKLNTSINENTFSTNQNVTNLNQKFDEGELNQLPWDKHVSKVESDIQNNEEEREKYSWVLDDFLKDSINRAIGRAISDCVGGKNKFEGLEADDCIVIKPTNINKFKQANWNELILCNYIHETINGNLFNDKDDYKKVSDVLCDKIEDIKDYY